MANRAIQLKQKEDHASTPIGSPVFSRTLSERFGMTKTSLGNIRRTQSQKTSQFYMEPGKPISDKSLTELRQVSEKQQQKATDIQLIDISKYQYPFENLVFEGGGAKGYAYLGCVEVLEDIGVTARRFAGTSIGSLTATMLACGYTAAESKTALDDSQHLTDRSCLESLCCLRNIFSRFGLSAGQQFTNYVGEIIKKKVGNPDITFKQLYELTGNELCIITVNINMMSTEYLHVKTFPHLPVRTAVRMSSSIPGYFQAVTNKTVTGDKNYFVDGGLICNYPIHVFDGWWLSMSVEDAFINKLFPLTEINRKMDKRQRFGVFNEKTLGFQVYAADEIDLMQTSLEKRVGLEMTPRPDTKIKRKRMMDFVVRQKTMDEQSVFFEAFNTLLGALQDVNRETEHKDKDDVIDYQEFNKVFTAAQTNTADFGLKRCHLDVLFGEDSTAHEVFKILDTDSDHTITFNELIEYIEKAGVKIQERIVGYSRRTVKNLTEFLLSIEETLLMNVKRLYTDELDEDRTVGIDTDYIQSSDFLLEPEDKEFLVQQGRKSTISFLKHYVHKFNPPLKTSEVLMEVDLGTGETTSIQNTQIRTDRKVMN